MKSTYSFNEMINLIRDARDWDTLQLIYELLKEEKYTYCLFDLSVISSAITLKLDYLSREHRNSIRR